MESEEEVLHIKSQGTTSEVCKRPTPPSPCKIPAPVVKRGRGRPPTVGIYCGIGQFRREVKAAKRRAIREEALKDMEECLEKVHNTRSTAPLPDEVAFEDERAGTGTEAILKQAELDCQTLLQISKRSGNLKGTCQKGITEAVSSLRQAVMLLSSKSRNEETRRLEEEVNALREVNSSLQKDLSSLKRKIESIERAGRRKKKRAYCENSSPPPPDVVIYPRRRRKIRGIGRVLPPLPSSSASSPPLRRGGKGSSCEEEDETGTKNVGHRRPG